MKRILGLTAVSLSAMFLLSGCIALSLDGGTKASVGQQLIDLKKALDADAIKHAEFNVAKQKILDQK